MEAENMESKSAYVVMKQVKFDRSLDEVECVCLTREKANAKCEELQNEMDSKETTYKFVFRDVELFE
jgi:hypothetical protein